MRSDQKSVNNSTTIGKEYASFIYAHLSKQTSLGQNYSLLEQAFDKNINCW